MPVIAARWRAWSHRVWGTSQPIFRGRGLFSNSGLIPLRRELTTVVGAPLPPPAWEGAVGGEQYNAAVEQYHRQYVEALRGLWEEWKEKCDNKGQPYCSLPNACPLTTRELPGETLRLHTCLECPNNYPWLLDPTGEGFNF